MLTFPRKRWYPPTILRANTTYNFAVYTHTHTYVYIYIYTHKHTHIYIHVHITTSGNRKNTSRYFRISLGHLSYVNLLYCCTCVTYPLFCELCAYTSSGVLNKNAVPCFTEFFQLRALATIPDKPALQTEALSNTIMPTVSIKGLRL